MKSRELTTKEVRYNFRTIPPYVRPDGEKITNEIAFDCYQVGSDGCIQITETTNHPGGIQVHMLKDWVCFLPWHFIGQVFYHRQDEVI